MIMISLYGIKTPNLTPSRSMPKPRNRENAGLPARWRFRYNAYYYHPPAVLKEHWDNLFPEEPGSEVETEIEGDTLTLTVKTCPAILHLKTHGREILPEYCAHCLHVSRGMCEPAGVSVQVEGGMGSCVQRFTKC